MKYPKTVLTKEPSVSSTSHQRICNRRSGTQRVQDKGSSISSTVQFQIESYQKLKKWYLIPPCLTLSIIRYVSRVKWSNPEKRAAPSPAPRCCSYRKGSLRVALAYGRQIYLNIYIYIYIYNTNLIIATLNFTFSKSSQSIGDYKSCSISDQLCLHPPEIKSPSV